MEGRSWWPEWKHQLLSTSVAESVLDFSVFLHRSQNDKNPMTEKQNATPSSRFTLDTPQAVQAIRALLEIIADDGHTMIISHF